LDSEDGVFYLKAMTFLVLYPMPNNSQTQLFSWHCLYLQVLKGASEIFPLDPDILRHWAIKNRLNILMMIEAVSFSETLF